MIRNKRLALEVNYNLGVAYYEKGRYWAYDKAEEAFKKVLVESGEELTDPSTRQLVALAHCGLAAIVAQRSIRPGSDRESLWRVGQSHYDQAITLVAEGSEVYVQALYALALLQHLNRQDFSEAQRLLQQVLSNNPYHWRAYTVLGQMAMAQKKPQEAISFLKKATTFAPDHEFAHYQLGQAYSMAKQTDMAIAAYSKAPSIAGAHVAWGRDLAKEKNDFEGAIAQFEQAIELNSQHGDAYADLAWYLVEGGFIADETKQQQAIKAAKEAVNLTKNDWRKLATLGRTLYECGQVEEALESLTKTQGIKPDAPHVHYYLARIDMDNQNYEKARERLSIITQLEQNEETRYWKKKVRDLMTEIKIKQRN